MGRRAVEREHTIDRVFAHRNPRHLREEAFAFVGHRGDEDLFLGREALVDRSKRDLCAVRDVAQTHGAVAIAFSELDGGLHDSPCLVVHTECGATTNGGEVPADDGSRLDGSRPAIDDWPGAEDGSQGN